MIGRLTNMAKYDFESSVGFVVNTTAKAFQKALDAELRKNVGVSISQWRVISTLVRQSGITQKEIADRVGIEGSTLVPIIDKMENMVMPKDVNDISSTSDKIPKSAWKTLAILSLIATMSMYAETMLVPAIPDLIKDFSISYSTSSWILTTYLIAGAIMTPISGKLSDIYGKKKVLLIIMIIYAAGVSAGGFTTNIYS